MEQAHKPLRCPQCGTDMPFKEYGSKTGKNGKPAKWPIYEKCKNPGCKTGRKTLGIVEPEKLPDYEPLPTMITQEIGQILQLPTPLKNYDFVYFGFSGNLRAKTTSVRSNGEEGTLRIHMHLEDLEIIQALHPEKVFVNKDDGSFLFIHPTDESKPGMVVFPKDIKVTKKYRYYVINLIKVES